MNRHRVTGTALLALAVVATLAGRQPAQSAVSRG